ncbi:hypothetical protein [Streptomyces sp. NPDC006510]|uniref:hypothetical protein n=1 Tax=Streptomyces sp. NPDC006510 TaxID=3155600 RepID=UPI0033B80C3B
MAPDGTTDVNGHPRRIVAGIRERHQTVHELLSQGSPLHGISRGLQLAYYAVRRHARIPDVDDLLVKVTSRRALLDDFKPYIYKRFAGLSQRQPAKSSVKSATRDFEAISVSSAGSSVCSGSPQSRLAAPADAQAAQSPAADHDPSG